MKLYPICNPEISPFNNQVSINSGLHFGFFFSQDIGSKHRESLVAGKDSGNEVKWVQLGT
jgi:hypothetical protein